MTILHVDSSILGEQSVSRILSRSIVDRLRAADPGQQVVYRDLAARPLDHLTAAHLTADGTAARDQAEGDAALREFLAADIIVIGAPMYNFSVPTQLKAWIDRLARAGETFKYTENGPVGLTPGKTVIVASSRGGIYSTGTAAALDHQESYLKGVFGLFGISDVRIVRAEGVNLSEAARTEAIDAAAQVIAQLAA